MIFIGKTRTDKVSGQLLFYAPPCGTCISNCIALLAALSLLACCFFFVDPQPAFAEGERGTVSTTDQVGSSSPRAQGFVSFGTRNAGGSHTRRVAIEVPATSSEDGAGKLTLTKCENTFTQAFPHSGHIWSDWEVDTASACVSTGVEHRICQNCGEVEMLEIPSLSGNGLHTWVEVDRKNPTVNQEGWILWKCSGCGTTYTETLQKLAQKETPAEESPKDNSAEQWMPSTLDYALAAIDAAVIADTAAFVVPLLAPLAWIRRKRDEAKANARTESGQEEGV